MLIRAVGAFCVSVMPMLLSFFALALGGDDDVLLGLGAFLFLAELYIWPPPLADRQVSSLTHSFFFLSPRWRAPVLFIPDFVSLVAIPRF